MLCPHSGRQRCAAEQGFQTLPEPARPGGMIFCKSEIGGSMKILPVALMLLFVAQANARLPVSWVREYEIPLGICYDGVVTQNVMTLGGACCYTGASSNSEGLVLWLSQFGDSLWSVRYPFTFSEWSDGGVRCMTAMANGDLVLAGPTYVSPGYPFVRIAAIDSAGGTLWSYVGSNRSTALSVVPVSTGGTITVGFTGYHPTSYASAWRLQVDGSLIWEQSYACSTRSTFFQDVIETSDASFLAVGYSGRNSWDFGTSDVYVVRIEPNGSPRWTLDLRMNVGTHARCCLELTDGGFLIGGSCGTVWYDDLDFLLVRMTGEGDTLWTRTYPMPGAELLTGLGRLPSGQFLLSGNRDWNGIYTAQTVLIFTDSSGVMIDTQAVRGSTWNLIPISEGSGNLGGGFMLVGGYEKFVVAALCPEGSEAAHPERILVTPHSTGYRLWHESGQVARLMFTGFPTGVTGWVTGDAASTWSVLPNGDGNDGDTVIFVSSVPLTTGSLDTFWLSRADQHCLIRYAAGCKTDTIGVGLCCLDSVLFWGGRMADRVQFRITSYGEQFVEAFEILCREYVSSPFVVLAEIGAEGAPDSNLYVWEQTEPPVYNQYLLAVRDSFGCRIEYRDQVLTRDVNLSTGEPSSLAPIRFDIAAFPNPFNPSTTLSFSLPREARARIAVFDILGREVAVLAENVFTAGEHRIAFNGSSLPSGLYFARLQSGSMQATHKLLLMK
jgi:hypothetical protein